MSTTKIGEFSVGTKIKKDLKRNRGVYLMLLPIVVYYIAFHYAPMYGAQIAFRDFEPVKGLWGSTWIGLENFKTFFDSYYFGRLIRNTVLLSAYDIIFGFPAPIILALMLNEVHNTPFKKFIQTVSYLPHFISTVVICGMILNFTAKNGLINQILMMFGGQSIPFLSLPQYFRPTYITSNVWQSIGWNSIIYLAAISNIDQQLYEAARIDGAGRFRQVLAVTIPSILPMIVILLILRLGNIMTMGAEKILLLYNASTYETADVISTFVYRKGMLEGNYSYSTAVGLFNSVINFTVLVLVNKISKKVSSSSLW